MVADVIGGLAANSMAFERFREPPVVLGGLMMGIATGRLLVNVVGLQILKTGLNESRNMRGAWPHVLTDALGSVGAIIGGALSRARGPRGAREPGGRIRESEKQWGVALNPRRVVASAVAGS